MPIDSQKIAEAKRKLDDAEKLSADGEPLAALEQAASALADIEGIESEAYDEAVQATSEGEADGAEAAGMESGGDMATASEAEAEADAEERAGA